MRVFSKIGNFYNSLSNKTIAIIVLFIIFAIIGFAINFFVINPNASILIKTNLNKPVIIKLVNNITKEKYTRSCINECVIRHLSAVDFTITADSPGYKTFYEQVNLDINSEKKIVLNLEKNIFIKKVALSSQDLNISKKINKIKNLIKINKLGNIILEKISKKDAKIIYYKFNKKNSNLKVYIKNNIRGNNLIFNSNVLGFKNIISNYAGNLFLIQTNSQVLYLDIDLGLLEKVEFRKAFLKELKNIKNISKISDHKLIITLENNKDKSISGTYDINTKKFKINKLYSDFIYINNKVIGLVKKGDKIGLYGESNKYNTLLIIDKKIIKLDSSFSKLIKNNITNHIFLLKHEEYSIFNENIYIIKNLF